MRTSEAERQRVADFLRDCCGEGRLSPEELDQRLEALWAGRTVADLEQVVVDLPGGENFLPALWPRAEPPSRRRSWSRAALALVALGAAALTTAWLPAMLVWVSMAVILSVVVTAVVLAVALAPAALLMLLVGWLAVRIWRGGLGPQAREHRHARRCPLA